MLALQCEGYSLAQIGRRFGVSRQRVDQILKRADGAGVGVEAGRARRSEAVRARRERHARRARERSGEILERYRAGVDPVVIARELGLEHELVRGLIGQWRTQADRTARARALQRAWRPRFSDAELVDGVRLVAGRVGRAPTGEQYGRLARRMGLASQATVYMRFGGWHKALVAAGLVPSGAGRVRSPRWSLVACWRAVVSVSDQLGDPPRYYRYARLAAVRADLPSGSTLRLRLGLWPEIVAALREHAARHEAVA